MEASDLLYLILGGALSIALNFAFFLYLGRKGDKEKINRYINRITEKAIQLDESELRNRELAHRIGELEEQLSEIEEQEEEE